MAKTLQFKVVEVELTEEEEDERLLLAMEATKNEPNASAQEVDEFKKWLGAAK